MEPTATQTTPESKKRLTLRLAREIFSKYRDDAGQLSMAHMYPYYHDNIHFKDSVQTIVGMKDFVAMGDRLLRRCEKGYRMEVHNAAQDGNIIFLHWTMTMRYSGTSEAAIDGTTILTLDEEGLIIDQRDHYDLWGDTFAVIPGLNRLYAWFLHKTMA